MRGVLLENVGFVDPPLKLEAFDAELLVLLG